MQIFIDSADPSEVLAAYATGMVDGVTTNPSLAASLQISYPKAVKEILSEVNGPVSLEVLSTDFEGMVKEGRKLAKLGKNVVVKIPMGVEGIKATQILNNENIKVNVTLVFSTYQALLAAKAGAEYVSPFVGRHDDTGINGMELIEQIRTMYDHYAFQTKILAASIRGQLHVTQAAILGADVATIPPAVFWKLFEHPQTTTGLDKFLSDFAKSGVEPLV